MMTRFLILTAFFSFNASAQKSIDGLVMAEQNFARHSVLNGTRSAFMAYLDSSGIIFQKRQPVNGLTYWKELPASEGVLDWAPQYAEISSSLDFGYTTGPWQFSARHGDTINRRGQYTTVWHLNKSGEWKFLVDLGNTGGQPPGKDIMVKKISVPKLKSGPSELNNLLIAEESFIKVCVKDKIKAYQSVLSHHSLLNRDGAGPSVSPEDRKKAIELLGEHPSFEILGSGIAASGDLGYVYGNSIINGKNDNYLRIWRREQDGWKIAVEVVHQ